MTLYPNAIDNVNSLPPVEAGSGIAAPVGPASGDLGGNYPNPLVTGIQGKPVPSPFGTNTLLSWTGSVLTWVAGGGGGGGITQLTGDVTTGPGSGSVPATVAKIQGVTISGTPSVGYVLEATSSTAASWQAAPSGFTAGGDLSGTSTSQTVIGIDGVQLSITSLTANQILQYNGTHWVNVAVPSGFTAGGDLTGTSTNQTVHSIQGVVISGTPSTGQVLTATSASAADWATPASGFTAGGDLTGTSTNQNVVDISGAAGIVNIRSTGNVFTWAAATTAPGITQTSIAGGTGANMLIHAQDTASGHGGNLQLQAGTGTTAPGGYVEVISSHGTLWQFGVAVGHETDTSWAAIYPSVTPTSNNFSFASLANGNELLINAASEIDFYVSNFGSLTGSITTSDWTINLPTILSNLAGSGPGYVAVSNTGLLSWAAIPSGFTAGGDLSGTSTSQNVIKIQGTPVSTNSVANDGYALVSVGGVYVPEGVETVLNVKNFGAKGDGTTDDTVDIQAAINYAASLPYAMTVYFPPGNYKISSSLNILGTLSTPVVVHLRGASGSSVVPTVLTWAGGLSAMLILTNVYECHISNLNFNGANTALACVWQKCFSSGCIYEKCNFEAVASIANWQPSTSYTFGQTITTPFQNSLPATFETWQDNGHLYTCTTAGSTTTGQGPNFNTGTGSTTADNGTLVWTESGPSPAAFLVGQYPPFPGGISEASDCHWTDCNFRALPNAAGWRPLSGGNVKGFHLTRCFFFAGIGIDLLQGSGSIVVEAPEFLGCKLDYRVVGCQLIVTGHYSEESNMLLFGNIGSPANTAQVVFMGGSWEGTTLPYAGAPVTCFGGQLTLEGMTFTDLNMISNFVPAFARDGYNDFPYLIVPYFAGNTASLRSCGNVFSYDNAYAGPFFLPVFEANFDGLLPGNPNYSSSNTGKQVNISSENDIFQTLNGATINLLPGTSALDTLPILSGYGDGYVAVNNLGVLSFSAGSGGGGGFTASGDLSGSSTSQTVVGIDGKPIVLTSLTTGNLLQYNGTDWVNIAPPGATGTAGGDLSGSYPNPTVAKIQGNTVTSGALTEGQFLIATSTSNWAATSLSGDVTESASTPGKLTVGQLQGTIVLSGTPSTGQVLTATSSTAADWQTPSGGGGSDSTLFSLTGNPAIQVINTTAETTLFSYTMPGGTLPTNGVLFIQALFDTFDNVIGTPLTFRLYLGSTVLLTYAPSNGSGTNHISCSIEASIVAAGATNAQYCSGKYFQNSGDSNGGMNSLALTTMGQYIGSTVDTTVSQVVKLTAQPVSASTNLYVSLYSAKVILD